MDPSDDDSQMTDAPESSTARNSLKMTGQSRRPANGAMLATAMFGSITANGLQISQRYTTPSSDNEVSNPLTRPFRDPSRESSVLANNVANNLSIETPQDGLDERLSDFMDELDDEEHEPTTPYVSTLPTGLCYDVRMRYHCELDPPKERRDYHPEDPRRIFKIYKELCIAGLVKDDLLNTGTLIPNPLVPIPARDVTESEVCLVHDKKHFDFMRSTSGMLGN